MMLFTKMRYRLALNSMSVGDYVKAENLFKKIQKSDPAVQGVGHNIGVCLMAQERYDEAEVCFRKEVETLGECYSRSVTLGDLYYAWGKREEAALWYGKSLEESPDSAVKQFLNRRIAICANSAKFEAAMEGCRLMKQGRAEAEKGEIEIAIDCYEQSFEKDPTQYQSLNEAGVLLLNHKREYARARDYFKKALRLSDLSPIRKNLGLAENMISQEAR